MTFAFLPGLLLLAAVPVILIWHLRRMWHRRVTVPTVEPWIRVLGASRRRRRLPRSLLMALHMAAAACLGLAAGVPVASRSAPVAGDVAIVLDVSASARAGEAQARRRAALEAANTAGLVTIVAAGREPRPILARGTSSQASAALAGVRLGEAGAQLAPAVVLASAVAGAGADVVVVSPSDAPPGWPASWIWTGEPEGATAADPNENRAVVRAALVDGRLLATIANLGTAPADVPTIVEADGALVDRRVLTLAAQGEVDAVWRVPDDARTVAVRLDAPDANDQDDRAVVAARHVRTGQVVGTSRSMDRALAALPGWQLTRTGRATYSVDGSADLTVFLNEAPADLPPGGVLIAGAAPVDAEPETVYATGGHPLTAGLDLTGVEVRSTGALTVPAWAEPILVAGERPIAYAGERSDGRVVVLGFDPDDPDSSFAKRPAFPVLVARAADWLAPNPPGAVPAGEWVDLPGGEHELSAPDGSTAMVSRRARTTNAGLYEVRGSDANADGPRFGAWAGHLGGLAGSNEDWSAARAAAADMAAGASGNAPSSAGLGANSIGPELAALALVLVLAEGLWRGLRPERRPQLARSGTGRLDEAAEVEL